jgi:DNA-binding SARP family transcriptional activator
MRYDLSLLRCFELRLDGEAVRLPGSAQRLTAFLALQQRPLARVCVAGRLWPDATEEHAFASLRSALWRARRPGDDLIEAREDRLGLGTGVEVDRERLVARARRLIGGADVCRDDDLCSELPNHDLLPGWHDDWVLVERERLRHLRLHALEALAQRFSELGRYSDAVDVALDAISAEPLRESAHRVLISVHLAEGNVGEARRQYALCGRLLRAELGLGPSSQLATLLSRPPARRGQESAVVTCQ